MDKISDLRNIFLEFTEAHYFLEQKVGDLEFLINKVRDLINVDERITSKDVLDRLSRIEVYIQNIVPPIAIVVHPGSATVTFEDIKK